MEKNYTAPGSAVTTTELAIPADDARPLTSAALCSHYFLFYAILGSYSPFLGLFLEKELRFGGSQIGSVFSARQLLVALAPPLWGYLSDRLRVPRILIAAGLAMSGASLLMFNELRIFWQIMALMIVFSFFNAPLAPLIDSLTLSYSACSRSRYGRFRSWGSLGFVFVSMCLWLLLRRKVYLGITFWAGAVFSMLAMLSLPLIPNVAIPRKGFVGRRAFRAFLQRDVLIITFCGFLGQAAMMGYYSFFGNYLHAAGFDRQWIGPIWAVGAVAEIPFIFFADDIIRRIGIRHVFALGLIGIAIRLFVLSLQPTAAIIIISQCLHAFTYGALFIAGLIYVNKRSPNDLRASAQTIYCAVLHGAGGILGSLAAGWLVDTFDIRNMMLIHSVVAAAGLLTLILFFQPQSD